MAKIGNIVLGQGLPKICIPLVARDEEGINRELYLMVGLDFDIVELRLDYFEGFLDTGRYLKVHICYPEWQEVTLTKYIF